VAYYSRMSISSRLQQNRIIFLNTTQTIEYFTLNLQLQHIEIITLTTLPIGHDPKSLALNLATLLLFLLPFGLYFDAENSQLYIAVVVACLLFSLIVPPVGWMRPHPYTDKPGNEPWTTRS
jgi:hypothetical protein